MLRFTFTAIAVLIFLQPTDLIAALVGDNLIASNSFQSAAVGVPNETFFIGGSSIVGAPGVELPNFATIFDVDFGDDELTMTFTNPDPTALFVNQYGAGEADRYYFGFDSHLVNSVTLASDAAATPGLTNGLTIGLITPGELLNLPTFDPANPTFSRTFANGGFFLEFGNGTDYLNTDFGDSVTFGLSTTAVPEPTSTALLLGIGGLAALKRRRSKSRSKTEVLATAA